MTQSEVARIREWISLEYWAAQRGFVGLSIGTTRHQFITARTENLGMLHEKLTTLIGADEATKILAETLKTL